MGRWTLGNYRACVSAKAAGATITSEPKTNGHGEGDWADRGYACRDPWGHHWWFGQRIETY